MNSSEVLKALRSHANVDSESAFEYGEATLNSRVVVQITGMIDGTSFYVYKENNMEYSRYGRLPKTYDS